MVWSPGCQLKYTDKEQDTEPKNCSWQAGLHLAWNPINGISVCCKEMQVDSVFLQLIREGRGMLLLFPPKELRGLLGPNPVYSMGASQDPYWWQRLPHKVPLQYLIKDTSTCSAQSCPRGAGIQTSNLPITSPPALHTELQPPQCKLIDHYVVCWLWPI